MTVTATQIQTEFPEFANTSTALINAKIADASAQLDENAFGDTYDQAMKYMTCHLIALSPRGEFARLRPDREPDGATTIYERRYLQLKRAISAPMAV